MKIRSILFYTFLFSFFIEGAFAADFVYSSGSTFVTSQSYSSDPFNVVIGKLIDLFINVKKIVFILGGFGLIAVSIGAIFGKIAWKWYVGLMMGLVVVAIAGSIVDYIVGDEGDFLISSWSSHLQDSL
ncbi:MAG: hypothetical protein EOM53_01085 [Alphaproteobacteria bacterium]|nr:hypothetical protein [Alphaproteobacteria bacterium]